MHNSEGVEPGPDKLSKWQTMSFRMVLTPSSWAFPRMSLSGRYSVANHFEVATSDEHPGLVALRTFIANDPPTAWPQLIYEAWIDPSHMDRTVAITGSRFKNSPDDEITSQTVQDYSDYGQYPAPDGRYYPRHCTETTYRRNEFGSLAISSKSESQAQFFPHRTLPEIPKNPATLPAASMHDMP